MRARAVVLLSQMALKGNCHLLASGLFVRNFAERNNANLPRRMRHRVIRLCHHFD